MQHVTQMKNFNEKFTFCVSSYNYLLSMLTVNHTITKWKYKKNPFALSFTVTEVQFKKYHNCTTHSCPSFSISSTSSASNCWIFLPAKQYQTLNSKINMEGQTCNSIHSSSWHWVRWQSASHYSCFTFRKRAGMDLTRGLAPEPLREELWSEIPLSLPVNQLTDWLINCWRMKFQKLQMLKNYFSQLCCCFF
jgi:hypothetical protein